MSDLISRQAVKDLLLYSWMTKKAPVILDPYLSLALQDIDELPSAEPKKGQWVFKRLYHEADECICSECGQLMTTAHEKRMRFCPNCGAEMEVE